MKRFIPASQCDSADDYYAQFEIEPESDFYVPDDDIRPYDDDCDYWKSNCYGRG